jgi:AcrR family transcriptional regulator
MTATSTVRPGRMTADERRDAIVAAGMAEFASGGLVGASTDAIAKRAGVSQPYVFQLFGTKKELFLAVVRRGFERTRLAFEEAARTYEPGRTPGCDTVLDALGQSYKQLLADRPLLLIQLQAYAACADRDVQRVVRQEFGGLHRRVRELTGASAEELQVFFAMGMLLNIAAAVELEGDPATWMLAQLEGSD